MSFFHKTTWSLFKHDCMIVLRIAKKKTKEHIGIGNRCADGRYVVFIDYDGHTPIEWIKTEVNSAQEDYGLDGAFLFKTKHGHHIIFLEKLYIDDLINILRRTTCDKDYLDVPLYYARKEWVLRQTEKQDEKIQYLGTIKPPKPSAILGNNECSLAHALFLHEIAKVPIEDLELSKRHYDDEKHITIAQYHVNERNN